MVLAAQPAGAVTDAPPARPEFHRSSFRAMGTECAVQFSCSSAGRAREYMQSVLGWVADFEARYSRFRPDSLVSRINASAGRQPVELDEEAASLFALCDWFYWSTSGVFDPSALPLVLLWDYHVKHDELPDERDVEAARSRVGWSRVRREGRRIFLPEAGMGIDLGGIGKEYAVDRVVEMALERGIRDIMVDFGHDVRVCGEPPEGGPWRIGLEDPSDPGKCWGGVAARDRAVCSSGDYLRHFEFQGKRYGHILDPRSGYPVHNGCSSVTVVAPTCTAAGILSTAVFVLGVEAGLAQLNAHYQAEGCICTEETRLYSRNFHEYII